MRRIAAILGGPADFPGWRAQARRLLAAEVSPEAVEWRIAGEAPGLFATSTIEDLSEPRPPTEPPPPTTRRAPRDLSETRAPDAEWPPPASDAAAAPLPTSSRAPGDLSETRAPAVEWPASASGAAATPPTTSNRAPGDLSETRTLAAEPAPSVPRALVDLSETAIRHRDPERFALLYRALWRTTHGEPALVRVATDPDIVRLQAMAKAVRRDAHKMHAFVRFREIAAEGGPRFVAWFEPEHHILAAEAGFFVRRFAGMRWSILTPSASAHWDGAALTMGPGGRRSDAPAEDAREDLWRAYYASIFNPARLKPAAMRAEMPVKYWRNLPEARLIPRLIAEAPRRAAEMVQRGASAPAVRRQRDVHRGQQKDTQPIADPGVTEAMPAPDLFTAAIDPAEGLAALRAEMLALNSLPPWTADATQMVFGEGPVGAPLLFVGEQPGDEEDIAGRPFVGPAGRLFNKAVEEAGIDRAATYVTNAVKHFKFKPTGRRRLHQSPDAGDITYYRPFLKREIDLVGPQLVVTLGATALRALTGKPLAINKSRGEVMPMADGPPIFPTVHPSYLLRLPDPDSKAREYERFVADLRRAMREVA
jgi:probable DNA metabolism protein